VASARTSAASKRAAPRRRDAAREAAKILPPWKMDCEMFAVAPYVFGWLNTDPTAWPRADSKTR
jgi:hypothetical protein